MKSFDIIPLTKGRKALVCKCHLDYVSKYKWQYHSNGYAVTGVYEGKHKVVRMHRLVNNTPEGLDTDHINGNKLDNRCSNLRTATRAQNNANAKIRSDNTSGYKGVSWDKVNNKWSVTIGVAGKVKRLGRFTNLEEAAKTFKEAHNKLYGEFSR